MDRKPCKVEVDSYTMPTQGVITCGSFKVSNVGYGTWEFTCDWLPGWHHEVECTEDRAMHLLTGMQAEYRTPEARRKLRRDVLKRVGLPTPSEYHQAKEEAKRGK